MNAYTSGLLYRGDFEEQVWHTYFNMFQKYIFFGKFQNFENCINSNCKFFNLLKFFSCIVQALTGKLSNFGDGVFRFEGKEKNNNEILIGLVIFAKNKSLKYFGTPNGISLA